MPYMFEKNGTVSMWKVGDTDVFFPEQTLTIGGKEKLRGGAPVCCPIFGSMPESEHYRSVNLPQHGLVRLTGNTSDSREHWRQEVLLRHTRHFCFSATPDFPWRHQVDVEVRPYAADHRLIHIVTVKRNHGDGRNEHPMPLSFALHPYFATYGQPFTIRLGDVVVMNQDVESDDPVFYSLDRDEPVCVYTAHGVITMSFAKGPLDAKEGGYSSVCVWTDAIEKYICVEPVSGKPGEPHLLGPGDTCAARCTMTFSPDLSFSDLK